MRFWTLLVLLILLFCIVNIKQVQSKRKNSRFRWKRPNYAMPWLKGKNVCAVEEVFGTRKRYYSECMAYKPRTICGKQTYVRYHCCTGFERADTSSKDCTSVVPMEDLMGTARNLYLKDYRNYIRQSDMEELLTSDTETYTVFAPENKAFKDINGPIEFALGTTNRQENLLSLHMTPGRYELRDMYNDQLLPSLLPGPNEVATPTNIRINKYYNGITTANCARIIIPDQVATNGVVHVVEKVMVPVEDQGSIMDLLLNDGRFEELVTALIVSGLATDLRDSEGHFTLVAPTDDAFHAAPEEVLQRILTDKEMLKRLLQYHVIDNDICAASIIEPVSLRTKEGQKVNLSCGVDDTITVNGVPVTDPDMLATNGVVHAVDEILIPDAAKSLEERLSELGLLQFMEYAQSSGLADLLDGTQPGNFTVFAPNAEAFEKLTKEQKRILQTNSNAVKKVFNYHVAQGKHDTKVLRGDQNLAPAKDDENGGLSAKIRVKVYHNDFGVNNAKIVSSNHQAGNGVIHIIDTIMFPPEESIEEKIKADPSLSTLRNVLQESGMERQMNGMGGDMTLFAPTNDAFDQMESSFMEQLMVDPDAQEKFLKYHLLEKPIFSAGIQTGLNYRFRTAAGEWIRVEQTEHLDPIRVNEEALVLEPDVETTNGVMHVIDTVLKCPCVEQLLDDFDDLY